MRCILNTKRVVGIIVLILGVVLIFTSSYIQRRVEEGRGQIKSAQKKVDQANTYFSVTPATKEVGKVVTKPAQKKIDKGRQQVGEYGEMAHWIKIGGIVLIVAGAAVILVSRKRRR